MSETATRWLLAALLTPTVIALAIALWHVGHPWPHWHGEKLHRHPRGRRTHTHPTWTERYEAWWDRHFPVK